MIVHPRRTYVLYSLLLTLLATAALATEPTSARVAVYFSPRGGATEAVVQAINAAQTQILVQAYSFTSAPIAKALVEAHKRGVKVQAVLDKSNVTGQNYSAATFLVNAGIPTLIDAEHAIAHSKVMVIDNATIITGSFNFHQGRRREERRESHGHYRIAGAGAGLYRQHRGARGALPAVQQASSGGRSSGR